MALTLAQESALLAAWQQRVAWRLIDRDRAYGAQCWDLSADWAEAVAGIDPVDFWTSPAPGPDQYAASSMWLYYPTHPVIGAKLARVGRHEIILPGDILVWARSAAYPGSHTAVALERTDPATGSVYCMTQNPGAARPERLTLAGYLGALRPRTTTPKEEEEDDMALDNKAVCHTRGGVQTVIIGERTSGWKFKYTTKATSGRNPENEKWAKFFDTGDFEAVTDRSMLDQWEASLDRQRQSA